MVRKRRIRGRWLVAAAMVLPFTLVAQAQGQATATEPVVLVVNGEVKQKLRLSTADIKAMTRTKVTVKGHDGVSHEYEGVTLQSLLTKAGVPQGHEIRGKNMTLVVVADASDGYRVVFSLAELDADFAGEQVIVADTEDGKALDAQHGPVQLVVPGGKRQGRWVRMLNGISVFKAGESK